MLNFTECLYDGVTFDQGTVRERDNLPADTDFCSDDCYRRWDEGTFDDDVSGDGRRD